MLVQVFSALSPATTRADLIWSGLIVPHGRPLELTIQLLSLFHGDHVTNSDDNNNKKKKKNGLIDASADSDQAQWFLRIWLLLESTASCLLVRQGERKKNLRTLSTAVRATKHTGDLSERASLCCGGSQNVKNAKWVGWRCSSHHRRKQNRMTKQVVE